MELYTQSETVRAAVQHERRVAGHLTRTVIGRQWPCRQWAERQWAKRCRDHAAITMPATTIITTSHGPASSRPRLELHFVMPANAGIQYSLVSQSY